MTSSPSWQGQIDLQFQTAPIDTHLDIPPPQQTILRRSYALAPYKIQRPFYPEPEICHTVILHSAGGVLGGDRLSARIHLGAHSQALITTAAAAKIYRSNGLWAHQQTTITLAEGAYLEWLPQETIVFDRACYQQQVQIDLGPAATFCGWEVVRLGRSAGGEIFSAGCWLNALEVWQGGQPLWIDRQRIAGEQWLSPQALAGQPLLGLMVWLGHPIGPEIVHQVRSLAGPLGGNWGVTAVAAGLVCRYRGADRAAVQAWFLAIWDLLRQQYRQRSACRPRVWPQ